MKIIIVGPAYPYRGGLSAFSERLACEFMSEGHEVELETFRLQYPSFLFPGKTQYATTPAPKNLKITRSINSIHPYNWVKVGRKLKKKNADLVIFAFWLPFMAPCLGTIARIVGKNKLTKQVGLVHNIVPHEKRIGDKPLADYFVRSVDAFVCLADSVLKDIGIFDSNKPVVLSPHPLYDHFGETLDKAKAAEYLHLDANVNYMLFFGFVRDYKGLDWLMEAYNDDFFEQNNVKLIVAGEFYGNADAYFAKEKELGLEGRIIWHNNFIPDNEVKYFFSLADIIVQPYKTATQSGVTQIAYHFEKPMLVTDVGGLSEIVPHGKVGCVVAPNPKAVNKGLRVFYKTFHADKFSNGLKEEKLRYSWGKMTKSILSLLSIKE